LSWLLQLLTLSRAISIYGSNFPLGTFLGNLRTKLTSKPYIVIELPKKGNEIFVGHLRNA